MDPEVLSMSGASKAVSNALHRLYLWDLATYACFVMMCTLVVWCLGYFWIVADYEWTLIASLRCGRPTCRLPPPPSPVARGAPGGFHPCL